MTDGDLMVASIVTGTGTGTLTAPTGWTLIDELTYNSRSLHAFRKTWSTGDSTSYTWTVSATDALSGVIGRITGQSATAPINASAIQGNASSTNLTAPGITTTQADCLLLAIWGIDGASQNQTPPLGMTERWDSGAPDQAGATEVITAAKSTGTRVATVGSAVPSRCALIAIAPAPAGITVTIGQVVETSTPQSIARLKTRSLGQVVESDSGQSISRFKTRAISQVLEGDTATALARLKVRSIGRVAETDSSQPIGRSKVRALVAVSETDAARTLAAAKSRTLTQVTESDSALGLDRLKRWAIAQVSETETALGIAPAKTRVLGRVIEGDTATALLASKRAALGQVLETDAARVITIAGKNVVVLGQVFETDVAQAIGRRKSRTLAQALEIDVAQQLRVNRYKLIALALESDAATALVGRKSRLLGQALEADVAQSLGAGITRLIARVLETDWATDLAVKFLVPDRLGDVALAIARAHVILVIESGDARLSVLSHGADLTMSSSKVALTPALAEVSLEMEPV